MKDEDQNLSKKCDSPHEPTVTGCKTYFVNKDPHCCIAQFQIVVCVSRSGSLFNTGFLRRMLSAAVQHSMDDIQPLVKTLICESECTTLKSLVHGPSALANQGKSLTSHLSCVVTFERWNVFTHICVSSAVECGVVIKTLQSGEDSGPADQSGESYHIILLLSTYSQSSAASLTSRLNSRT